MAKLGATLAVIGGFLAAAVGLALVVTPEAEERQRSRRRRGRLRASEPAPGYFGEPAASEPMADDAVATCAPVASGQRMRLCLSRPARLGPALRTPDDVCKLLRGAALADRESFYGVHLDAQNRVLGVEEVARGSASDVTIHPREVFKSAFLSNAVGLIVAHNHPSGIPKPSPADVELTQRLIKAGDMLGVPIRDHVIVGAEGCFSFQSQHPLPGLRGLRDD